MRIVIILCSNCRAYYKINFGKISYNYMKINKPELIMVGGGLAGSEAAWQVPTDGMRVCLYEMRFFFYRLEHIRVIFSLCWFA
jgi:hypothetical protein